MSPAKLPESYKKEIVRRVNKGEHYSKVARSMVLTPATVLNFLRNNDIPYLKKDTHGRIRGYY